MATTLKIEHYTLGKTIGVGASSKVKVAKHEYTDTNVAIKIINKKRMKSSNMGAKIKREIRLLRYFNHPNIIRLYEVLETQTDIYVVMEYISGGELFELIALKGKLQDQEAKFYFQQIISGVEYCHLNLVAHRDLKPENILVDETNTVKIADFGLSNLMKDGKFLKTSCGSPNYAAPEVILGNGIEIDTWSCGVILFALVSGYLPFDEDIVPALFKKIKEADYHIPTSVNPLIADLIHRMLQPDPTRRIPFSMIKKHPWLSDSSPLCMQISLTNLRMWFASKLDDEIFNKTLKMEFNFHNLREQQVRDSILRRRDYSFVVGYDLMMNQKMKTHILESQQPLKEQENKKFEEKLTAQSPIEQCKKTIEKDVEYVLTNFEKLSQLKAHPEWGEWQYGLVFQASPRLIMQVIIETLGQLDTTYVVKSADYKIKCFHKLHTRKYSYDAHQSMKTNSQNEIGGIPKLEDKFTKKEIIFNVQIYQMPNTVEHLVDIQRTKGNSMVFMDFCQSLTHFLCINMNRVLSHYQEIYQLQPSMLQLPVQSDGLLGKY